MPDSVSIPLSLEIVIAATPVSSQGSSSAKEPWKLVVSEGTGQRLRELTDWYWLDEQPVSVTIFYFPGAAMVGDIDNIVKPILDAMKTIVYHDDDVVERVLAQRFEPGLSWSFGSLAEKLAAALDRTPPVVLYGSMAISPGGRFHDC
ncbi:MAG TPA: RusA family crossover junction endodeoxyribonuclease [Acetobacteraceae bacterium]|nr:RusA family crossover junction endodeoxyribonuclease [Acetobacteraceae bacterium]